MRRLLIPVLFLVLGLAAVCTPAARANDSQLSIMMDDDHLLYRGDGVRDDTLRRMQALGVDYVRVSVLWNVVAQNAKKGKRGKKFKGDKPGTYPIGNWDRYDRLVRAANRIGWLLIAASETIRPCQTASMISSLLTRRARCCRRNNNRSKTCGSR